MSEKSQKNMRRFAYVIAAIVFAAFVVLFFVGKVGDYIGVTSDTSSESVTSAQSTVSVVTDSAPLSNAGSKTEDVQEASNVSSVQEVSYKFRNANLLNQHYEKHGKEIGRAHV